MEYALFLLLFVVLGTVLVIRIRSKQKQSESPGPVVRDDLGAASTLRKAELEPKVVSQPKSEPAPKSAPKAEEKKLPSNAKLKSMTKLEIEAVGREFGTELDRRKTKANMISDLHSHLGHKAENGKKAPAKKAKTSKKSGARKPKMKIAEKEK